MRLRNARDVVIFGVENNSWSHTDNRSLSYW